MATRKQQAPKPALTLQAETEAEATQTYTRRMAELKALAPLLARLDELRPALAERGLTIYPNSISLTSERLAGGYASDRHKVLRLRTDAMFERSRPSRWLAALRELGMEVLDFTKTGSYGSALLRKNRLLLRVDLADPDRDALLAAQPAPKVLHCAAGQVADTARANPDATVVCTTAADGQPLAGGYAMAAQPAVDFANREEVPA